MSTGTCCVTRYPASLPSPPPPYTPPTPESASRSVRPSPLLESSGFIASPLSAGLLSSGRSVSRPGSNSESSTQFPPPPASRPQEKSTSGADRESPRLRFSLSGLAARVRRSDGVEPTSTVEPLPSICLEPFTRPPAARRAASTGAIGLGVGSMAQTLVQGQGAGRSSPGSTPWEPGMPLPPPPPGPPPTTDRSRSLNRYRHNVGGIIGSAESEAPFPARRTAHSSTLGEIPPTPADWVDDGDSQQRHSLNKHEHPSTQIEGDTAARRAARRDLSVDSIRERRSRSRPANGTENPKPADLVLSTNHGLLRKRRVASQKSPEVQLKAYQASNKNSCRDVPPRNLSTLTPPYTPATTIPRGNVLSLVSTDVSTPEVVSVVAKSSGKPDAMASDSEAQKFAQASLDRYMTFIQQEIAAPTDGERLDLFARYVIHESRLRRDRYSTAFGAMAGDIMDLSRDMWRPSSSLATPRAQGSVQSADPQPSPSSSRQAPRPHLSIVPSSNSSTAELTPATDTESIADVADGLRAQEPTNAWGEKFRPSLSPIPSMAMSTVADEESSRGRSSSRWWEDSAEGSVGQGGRKLERTKQELKYMSLHPDELAGAVRPSPALSTPTPGTSRQHMTSIPNGYPAEKVRWHEDQASTPLALSPQPLLSPHSATMTTRGKAPGNYFQIEMLPLDVSRLVTLPPPYPRHYPAVNNCHPSLSELRSRHRSIADLSALRSLSQQEEATEMLHRFIPEKLRNCEDCIQRLVASLEETACYDHTISAQTEGDERPELLEQLTLLKWLFESREQIQKQSFDAWSQSIIDQYQPTILYCTTVGDYARQCQEEDERDGCIGRGRSDFAEHAMNRFTILQDIIERHVSRGVETQLSAFWDIAPGLLEIIQKVPEDLHGFEIEIPRTERDDNAAYQYSPLQYLVTVLSHAKKSAYQFIESQTNLLCLLHEVRTATMSASLRVVEVRRTMAGEQPSRLQAEMGQVRKEREDNLTEDLKEKVGEVDRQWDEALGRAIEACIARVKAWLQETGGWDEGLDV